MPGFNGFQTPDGPAAKKFETRETFASQEAYTPHEGNWQERLAKPPARRLPKGYTKKLWAVLTRGGIGLLPRVFFGIGREAYAPSFSVSTS